MSAVAPGIVQTDPSNFIKADAGRDYTLGIQASGRLAKPQDIASAVFNPASDAYRWVTGACLHVDGGSRL